MKNITIKENTIPDLDEVLDLYNDVSWTTYTSDPQKLNKALKNSLKVWTAWDGNLLVGLARVVGDDCTIIYIQDLLVLEDYQGMGIGSEFIKIILENYKNVRQIVLLTDKEEQTIAFYEKNGMSHVSKYNCVAYMK